MTRMVSVTRAMFRRTTTAEHVAGALALKVSIWAQLGPLRVAHENGPEWGRFAALVEAAGVEPASVGTRLLALHA